MIVERVSNGLGAVVGTAVCWFQGPGALDSGLLWHEGFRSVSSLMVGLAVAIAGPAINRWLSTRKGGRTV